MKNVLLLIAAGIAALSTSFAACADSQGAFVQANVGHTNTEVKSSSAYGVLGGYRWAVDAPFYLGVEGGYMNLNRAHFTYNNTLAFTTSIRKSASALPTTTMPLDTKRSALKRMSISTCMACRLNFAFE